MDWERPLTFFGVAFILIGIAFILVPILVKLFPTVNLQKMPWFIFYIYQRDGFFFATSPILIIISLVSFLWSLSRQ